MFDNPLLDRLAGDDGPAPQQPFWRDHPKFAGVWTRRLASGAESAGRFTTLLVSMSRTAVSIAGASTIAFCVSTSQRRRRRPAWGRIASPEWRVP